MGTNSLTIRGALRTVIARRFPVAAVSASLLLGGVVYAAEKEIPKEKQKPGLVRTIPGHIASVHPVKSGSASTKSVKNKKKSNVQIGSASWYGKAFQGRPTASGESYDMYRYTAAHRNLPLGTWVRVTNLRNGKSLIVKVNDRGPFVDMGNRIMDLSYAAARMLEFSGQGITRVKLEVVEPETIAYAAQGSGLE
jgi:rare lipoprotein A (peptidoglycan hydrolase)